MQQWQQPHPSMTVWDRTQLRQWNQTNICFLCVVHAQKRVSSSICRNSKKRGEIGKYLLVNVKSLYQLYSQGERALSYPLNASKFSLGLRYQNGTSVLFFLWKTFQLSLASLSHIVEQNETEYVCIQAHCGSCRTIAYSSHLSHHILPDRPCKKRFSLPVAALTHNSHSESVKKALAPIHFSAAQTPSPLKTLPRFQKARNYDFQCSYPHPQDSVSQLPLWCFSLLSQKLLQLV